MGLFVDCRRLTIFFVFAVGLVATMSASVMATTTHRWASLSGVAVVDSPICGEAFVWRDLNNDIWICSLLHTTWDVWGEPLPVGSARSDGPEPCSQCFSVLTVPIREPVTFTSFFTAKDGVGQNIGYHPYPHLGSSFVAQLFPGLEPAIERFIPADVFASSVSIPKKLNIPYGSTGSVNVVPRWKVNFHVVAVYLPDEAARSDEQLWRYSRVAYGMVTLEAIDWKFGEHIVPTNNLGG